MIVRERRRVAALAKTASALDERLHTSEQNVEASAATLRSCIDEHRQEIVELTQTHQDHILSLMDMVRVEADSACGPSEEEFQKKLLVLANERLSMLEDELTELRAEKTEMGEFASRMEELKVMLQEKTDECEKLEDTRAVLRTVLRQLRDEASRHQRVSSDGSADLGTAVVRMVDEYLHPDSPMRMSPNRRRNATSVSPFRAPYSSNRSSRMATHVELLNSSDSESFADEVEDIDAAPDWSNSIMADLALIAEGKVPESLNSPKFLNAAMQLENGAASDTQKISVAKNKGTNFDNESSIVADAADSSSIETRGHGAQQSENDPHVYKSVFERLGSPSQFTGTQKERFQEHAAQRSQSADEVASRVLHTILDDKDEEVGASESSAERASAQAFRSEYVKQNVFDRLQKTTTLAAAVRQNETLHHDSRQSGEILSRNPTGASSSDAPSQAGKQEHKQNMASPLTRGNNDVGRKNSSDKPHKDVFERLAKTTTEAYAKKTNRSGH